MVGELLPATEGRFHCFPRMRNCFFVYGRYRESSFGCLRLHPLLGPVWRVSAQLLFHEELITSWDCVVTSGCVELLLSHTIISWVTWSQNKSISASGN